MTSYTGTWNDLWDHAPVCNFFNIMIINHAPDLLEGLKHVELSFSKSLFVRQIKVGLNVVNFSATSTNSCSLILGYPLCKQYNHFKFSLKLQNQWIQCFFLALAKLISQIQFSQVKFIKKYSFYNMM